MPSTNLTLALITVAAPLVGFAVIALFLQRLKVVARFTALGVLTLSMVCSSLLLWQVNEPTYREVWSFNWLIGADSSFQIGLLLTVVIIGAIVLARDLPADRTGAESQPQQPEARS